MVENLDAVGFRINLETSLTEYSEPEEIIVYSGQVIALDQDLEDMNEIGYFRLTHVSPYAVSLWTATAKSYTKQM